MSQMVEQPSQHPYTVPAGWLSSTATMPGHCARHGAPVTRRVDFDLQSRPQGQYGRTGTGNVLGLAARLSDKAQNTRITKVHSWPLCRSCHRTHRTLRVTAGLLFWGGLVAVAGSIAARVATGETQALLLISMLGGLVAVILSAFVFGISGLARITGAQTSTDGSAVLITNAHPRFVEELAYLLRHAYGHGDGLS